MSSEPAGKAIVTHSRSWQALTAIQSLGRRGVEVICGDEYRWTPGTFSRHSSASFTYPNPEEDGQGFLAALEEAVEEHRPRGGEPYVLMPVHRETYAIAAERERFAGRVALPLTSSENIELARDKGRLAAFAGEHGVATPRTWWPRGAEEAREAAAEISFPAFVKGRRGAAGVSIERVEDASELLCAFRRLAERPEDLPILQEAVPGEEYCVTTLFEHGAARAVLTYRNIRKLTDSGPGVVRETVAAPAPERAARRLLEALGWHGLAQVDFLWDGRGEPRLLEVNPRFFSGMFQAVASGVDYPWMLYQLAAEGRVDPPAEVALDTRTETPVLGLLALVQELMRDTADSPKATAQLEEAWREARWHFSGGTGWQGVRHILRGLKESLSLADRRDTVRRILEENEDNLSILTADEDPFVTLGLLYPVAIFLRHGKVTPELLAGIGDTAPEA